MPPLGKDEGKASPTTLHVVIISTSLITKTFTKVTGKSEMQKDVECLGSMALAQECRYEIMPHPPHSQTSTLSNFFLLPNMNNLLHERSFSDS